MQRSSLAVPPARTVIVGGQDVVYLWQKTEVQIVMNDKCVNRNRTFQVMARAGNKHNRAGGT